MRPRVALITILLSLTYSATALAHAGHGPVMAGELVKAGPYLVEVEFSQWPVQSGTPLAVAVIPATGMNGMSGRVRLVPASDLPAPTISQELATYPGAPDAWTFQTGGVVGSPGRWTWEFELNGPRGGGSGKLDLEVLPPPPTRFQRFGWLLGLIPLAGLLWFGARQRRRHADFQSAPSHGKM